MFRAMVSQSMWRVKKSKRDSIAGSKRQLLEDNTIFWRIWHKVQSVLKSLPSWSNGSTGTQKSCAGQSGWYSANQYVMSIYQGIGYGCQIETIDHRSVLKKCRQCWKQEYEHQPTVNHDVWISTAVNNGFESSSGFEKQSLTICRTSTACQSTRAVFVEAWMHE